MSPEAESSLVGRSAAVQIEAGTPWSESLLVASAGVPDGLAVVGAVLEPGGYPVGELADGDVVDVLVVPERREDRAPAVLVERAEVFRVEALDDQRDQLLVSLLVPTAQRVEVAGAAAAGELMLVAGS